VWAATHRRGRKGFAKSAKKKCTADQQKNTGNEFDDSQLAGTARTWRMDMTWITPRISVGGGIWNAEDMAEVARAGITHVIDMQIEFDDTELAKPYGIEVLWNAVDDDFQPKGPEVFQRGVEFAQVALDGGNGKLFIHCAAGVHRAPMMMLALLCSMGWELGKAIELIEEKRPVVDFPDVYVNSVENFLQSSVFGRPWSRNISR
jgi:protein-tyrosine phosphatase